MPVEIKELVIRAVVVERSPEEEQPAPSRADDRDLIVEQCVRQVLAILRKSAER